MHVTGRSTPDLMELRIPCPDASVQKSRNSIPECVNYSIHGLCGKGLPMNKLIISTQIPV